MSEYRHMHKNQNSKLPIGLLAFVLIILIGVVAVQVSNLYVQSLTIEQQRIDIERAISAQVSEHKSLLDYQQYQDTDDYIEQLARERLNLIKADEIKMVPTRD